MQDYSSRKYLLSGFTLIELMVTVAIVAILASIAVPSYSDYVMRGRIPEATANLAVKRIQMEQYFQDNKTYVNAPPCAVDATSGTHFTFSCVTAATATSYTLQAVGSGPMTGFTYTVDQSNAKSTTAVPSGWTTSASCWVTKKNGGC